MSEIKIGSRVQYKPVRYLEPTIRIGTVRSVDLDNKKVYLHGYLHPFYSGCISVIC